jgi:cephalosporin-C deacetylase
MLFDYYAGPKQIKVWPFNQHEGGGSYQAVDKIQFLRGVWQRARRAT